MVSRGGHCCPLVDYIHTIYHHPTTYPIIPPKLPHQTQQHTSIILLHEKIHQPTFI